MQIFGKFETQHDLEYLVEQYIYFNKNDEKIDTATFEELLKNRRKKVAGTIFLYNPTTAPKGFDLNKKLSIQGYDNWGEYEELVIDPSVQVFESKIKNYDEMLIEVKYLFNFNKDNIIPTTVLEEFESDLDRYNSNQATRFSREFNYHDVKNIRLSGKFVFFGWGHKFDKHHPNIFFYAKSISQQAQVLGKAIAFVYNDTKSHQDSIDDVRYFHPIASGKIKSKIADAIKKSFESTPPVAVQF